MASVRRLTPGQTLLKFSFDPVKIKDLKNRRIVGARWSDAYKGWIVPEECLPEWAPKLRDYPLNRSAKLWKQAKDHQRDPLVEFARKHCGFFLWQMGLGKTYASLATCELIGAKKILVLTLAAIVPNWQRECELWGMRDFVEVVSYRSLKDAHINHKWDAVIFDESHSLGRQDSNQTLNCLRLMLNNPQAARYLLTGSPVTANLMSVWSQLTVLSPRVDKFEGREYLSGRFGSYSKFVKEYTEYTEGEYGGLNVEALKEGTDLVDRMQYFTSIESLSTSGVKLPPLKIETIDIPAGSDVSLRAIEAADRASKLPRPTCVMAYNRAVAEDIAARLGAPLCTGETPAKKRDKIVQDKPEVLVCTTLAMGTGINLTHWPNVLLAEPHAVPWQIEQALARFHRIGQENPVNIFIMQYLGTRDEAVAIVLKDRIEHNKSFFFASSGGAGLLQAFDTGKSRVELEFEKLTLVDDMGLDFHKWSAFE